MVATDGELQRVIGQLEGRVRALEEQNQALLSITQSMSADLAAINRTLAEARGGWRMLIAVGGAGAAVGGLISAIMGIFKG